MRLTHLNKPQEHLSYCSNIHPGESWAQTQQNLMDNLPGIRDVVAPEQDFGIGLRLSAQAANDFRFDENLAQFKHFLSTNPFYLFTINGFPYGPFHGTTVKEAVYLPDWLDPERLRYTNELADLMAYLIDDNVDGSISTVPGAFKASIRSEGDVQIMAHNLIRHVAHLLDIKRDTGKHINLALEPEPCCFLETIDETCHFFSQHLFSNDANNLLCQLTGIEKSAADRALHEHLTVCLDICHAAVEYEDAKDCLAKLAKAECNIGKLQISAGLKFDKVDTKTKALLKPFEDNVYLHQVIARNHGKLERYTDLHEAFAAVDNGQSFEEWRVHFHIPVFLDHFGDYKSTQFFIKDLLALHKQNPISKHLEVETYTWGVLPESLKTDDMQQAVIRELQWVLAQLK